MPTKIGQKIIIPVFLDIFNSVKKLKIYHPVICMCYIIYIICKYFKYEIFINW